MDRHRAALDVDDRAAEPAAVMARARDLLRDPGVRRGALPLPAHPQSLLQGFHHDGRVPPGELERVPSALQHEPTHVQVHGLVLRRLELPHRAPPLPEDGT